MSLAGNSCFLDTSFILGALVYHREKPSDAFTEILLQEVPIFIEVVVLSEILHVLENMYFQEDNPGPFTDGRDKNQKFKAWRKAQAGSYITVLKEYRSIIDILKITHNIQLIPLEGIDDDPYILLNEKQKFPPLDANDCIHYLSAKNWANDIDLLVNSDSDFSIIDSENKPPMNHSIF